MADPVIMTANERWKSLSRTCFQLGAVLLSAAVVETYNDGALSLETGGWFLGSCALILAG